MKLKERLDSLKACPKARKWVGDRELSESLWRDCPDPSWVLWGAGKGLEGCPPDILIACAKARPWYALIYAAKLLPPEVLADCAKARPGTALEYAVKLLPPDVLEYWRKATLS